MKRAAGTLARLSVVLLLALFGCSAPPVEETPAAPPENPIPQILATLPPVQPTLPAPQMKERRLLTVDRPEAIWVGESDRIQLALEVDEQGRITPTVEQAGHELSLEPIEVPDLYDTHNLVLEARLDMAGIEVQPDDSISETMQRGKTVRLFWSLSPASPGVYRGTLWIYLNLVPKDGGSVERQTLLALPIDVEGRSSLLGLPVRAARWTGVVGSVFGFVLGFPFLDKILSYFWRSLRKRSGK